MARAQNVEPGTPRLQLPTIWAQADPLGRRVYRHVALEGVGFQRTVWLYECGNIGDGIMDSVPVIEMLRSVGLIEIEGAGRVDGHEMKVATIDPLLVG